MVRASDGTGTNVNMNDLAERGDPAHEERAFLTACLCRLSQGDKSALEDLYQRTSAKLFSICLRILSDRGEAEDVLQDVYMTVWSKAAQFRAMRGVSPISWLAIIARHRSLDLLRTRKRQFSPIDEAAMIVDTAPLADASLQTSETSAKLSECMENLKIERQMPSGKHSRSRRNARRKRLNGFVSVFGVCLDEQRRSWCRGCDPRYWQAS